MNVDSLRRRRAKKLGVRPVGYSGQRRVFFVLDRATRKFPGELALWMQYLEFAKHVKANKKLLKMLDEVLRLHPTKPDLWIWASQHHISVEADFVAARNCMQAAMRFCPRSPNLWLEYARLEVAYLAKIAGRRKIMGLDEIDGHEGRSSGDIRDENLVMLPTVTYGEANLYSNAHNAKSHEIPGKGEINLDSILKGAIPQAIFDDAMKNFNNDVCLSEQFFNLFWEHKWIEAIKGLSEYVVEHMLQTASQAPETLACKYKLRLEGISAQSPNFPNRLSNDLQEIKDYTGESPTQKADLISKFMLVLIRILERGNLDTDIRTVLLSSLKAFSRTIQGIQPDTKKYHNKLDELIARHPLTVKYFTT